MYAASDAVATYEGGAGDDPLAALGNSIPGVPGEDYPIYAEVPESGFVCDGQVDGGEYKHIRCLHTLSRPWMFLPLTLLASET